MGREYGYCMHPFPEYTDIESNARSIVVNYWFNFKRPFCGNARIELIFAYRDKFIIVLNEGLEDNGTYGMVSCCQLFVNSYDDGAKYLKRRSPLYRITKQLNITRRYITSYEEVFNGPIREINDYYVGHKWMPCEIVRGEIELEHASLWYATNLFAKLTGIPASRLIIEDLIIRIKKKKEKIVTRNRFFLVHQLIHNIQASAFD